MDKHIVNKSIEYLAKDKKLKTLIDKYPAPQFSPNNNYFDALCKSIIYQQLSGKVAKIIYGRFLSLFENQTPISNQCLKIKISDLRSIGLSKQKIKYITNVANFFIAHKHNIPLKNNSEQEIKNQLIAIKGIGQWTIDMFMMFTLCKSDILPVGDLGIKKAFQKLYNLEELPSESFMESKSLKWKPYRTIACCYLWMIVDDGDVW